VALVTGAASGIGLATARLLAQHGARMVIGDLARDAGEKAAHDIGADGAEALFVEADVTDGAQMRHAIDAATERFGKVEIFHNNAGIGEGGESLFDEGARFWEKTLDVDLRALIQAVQLEVQYLRRHGGGGVIINTASMAGLVPVPTTPVYAASKAGVIHFTRSLAYLAAEGIRVNAVCPTFTDTPMVRVAGEAAIQLMKREVGGLLRAEQVAEGVLELVRDDSRAGAVMRVTVRKGIDYRY
jgi:NAD(P)-dependent dehydrogenase (short-subunit alcohol dehydrogenase family)